MAGGVVDGLVAGADFTWRDGERVVRFGEGSLEQAPGLLTERGFDDYALVTTARALTEAPVLGEGAVAVVHVPQGPVPETAAAVRPKVVGRPLVALGGGRVIDSAKALAAVDRVPCAAVPTTLSGAELTRFHRLPAGAPVAEPVRPSLVIAEPRLMASQPMPDLAASAMNALAHAVEALYASGANPVAEMAALRAAELIAAALSLDEPARGELALGALLAGYAMDSTGYAVHHVVCQTIVALAGTAHAGTNAVMLPHSVRLMSPRAPEALGRLAVALGDSSGEVEVVEARVGALVSRTAARRLSELGVDRSLLPQIAARAALRPELPGTPTPPEEAELLRLLTDAW